jgi:hypothetical protein
LWREELLMGKVQDDVMHDWNNTPHSNMFNPFMDETEVTNFMYLEYLDWLKNVFHKVRKVINIFMKVLHLIL